jgi:catechol 2,3-dioxygenase-like lactoylglutathione lyase family enzyme
MRLDHIAYRVADRDQTVRFFMEAFDYQIQEEFEIFFNEEKTEKALCVALEPPEKSAPEMVSTLGLPAPPSSKGSQKELVYHLAPEIFVSEGTPGSIVHNWVQQRQGIGGIHHMAYQVPSVEKTMHLWRERGWAEFTTNETMKCPGLTQIFTKPHPLTGLIYEFIERGAHGFCKDNVKDLMESTKDLT